MERPWFRSCAELTGAKARDKTKKQQNTHNHFRAITVNDREAGILNVTSAWNFWI
jgi:hypothetical protein